MTEHLPPPARASGIGEFERITHRREWSFVHVGFDVLYGAVLVMLAVVSVNTAAASLLGYERVVVTPLRLLQSGLPLEAQLFSGVVAVAWLALVVGALMLARAPGHVNLKVYAVLAAVFFALGALFVGGLALVGFALLTLYLHGLGRAWYYETMRRHGVVLLFALAVFALVLVMLGTRIPPGFAFGNVVGAEYRDLPLGAPLSLITALLPWWLWALWFMHVLHLGRRVTAVIKHPKPAAT